jgi:uncharacterized protein (UPF0297 family)
MDGKTGLVDESEDKRKKVSSTIKEVCDALNERGYNPINQIVGYLISGDPGYISGYKDSRWKILEFDRVDLAKILLEDYIHNNK